MQIQHNKLRILNTTGNPSVSLQGIEHVILADVEADPHQDAQATGLQQQQPACPQALTHRQTLRHSNRLQTLHPTQGLVLHQHLIDQTQGKATPLHNKRRRANRK